jgi:hypothetical protein
MQSPMYVQAAHWRKTPPAFWLASALSLALSIAAALSGWQRGGYWLESSLWAMLSILAVLVVHLLPALLYQRGWLTLAAFPVWLGVFGVVAFSHAQFFTLAEIHAGQERLLKTQDTPLNDSKLMPPLVIPPTAPGRTAAAVARELSKAAALLSRLPETKRPAQQQVVDALRLELAAVQQTETSAAASLTRQLASIEARQADPVGLRLGQVLGLPVGNVMLAVALATALVLELASVVLWRLALVPPIPSPSTGHSNWWDRGHGWRWWPGKVQQAVTLSPEPAAAVPDSEPVSFPTLASSNDAAAILALLKSRGALTAGMLQASVSKRIRPTLADLLAALEQAGQIKITAQGRGRVVELV